MKLKNLLLIGLCFLAFVQCTNEKEEYYERPEWLEDPIYQVLEAEGRFSLYLQCVDRTEYTKVLKGAAISTIFAPNDEAFTAYLKEKSYSSVEDIPEEVVKELVAYSIVYNSRWESNHLSDSFVDGRYEPSGAFKKRTNSYALPYRDPEFDNQWVVDETSYGGFSFTVVNYEVNLLNQNFKYLPIYSSEFFNSFPVPLTTTDYNTFYPHSTYTGRNVQEGTILKSDIRAENGIIHEVSKVSEPLPNIDDILREAPYKPFRDLLEYKVAATGDYLFKGYMELPEVLAKAFQKSLPYETIDKVYFKTYANGYLAFSPILENITDRETGLTETETNGNTLFVPDKNVLDQYINNRILQYYKDMDKLPVEVLGTLIETHMANGLIWPSKYAGALNATGEFINGTGLKGNDFHSDGILDSRVASNGFVYHIDHVIKSRYFETVYSSIYLNPDFYWTSLAYDMYFATSLKDELTRSILTGDISDRFTLLNFSNKLLEEDGFVYDPIANTFSNEEMVGISASSRFTRLIRSHVFPGVNDGTIDSEVTSFSGPVGDQPVNYNGWAFIVNYYGDMIRYKNNQLQAVGNIEDNTVVNVTKVNDEYNNGTAFTVDNLLQYSQRATEVDDNRFAGKSLWHYLNKARQESGANVSSFVNYVEICLKAPDSEELAGINPEVFYTVLMVNNSAMNRAVLLGDIPRLDSLTSASTEEAKIKYIAEATKFLNAHFLQGTVFPDDGRPYLYPVNPMSPNLMTVPTLHRITNEELGLVNRRALVNVEKTTRGILRFTPQAISLGGTLVVNAGFGDAITMAVQRGRVTGTAVDANIFKSNRIAGRAVLHEVNNYFTFEELNP